MITTRRVVGPLRFLLVVAFAWGALVATTVSIPGSAALENLVAKLGSPHLAADWGAALTGPTVEEIATRERRGLWSSLQYVTLIAGQLVALSVLIVLQAVLPKPALAASRLLAGSPSS